jgi:hypothetical protein
MLQDLGTGSVGDVVLSTQQILDVTGLEGKLS